MTKDDGPKERLSIFTKQEMIKLDPQSPSFLQHKLSIIESHKESIDDLVM
jgi:hypothetical protein